MLTSGRPTGQGGPPADRVAHPAHGFPGVTVERAAVWGWDKAGHGIGVDDRADLDQPRETIDNKDVRGE
jgi:hypothetical protein